MNKALMIYPAFVVGFALLIITFVTTTTYTQLGIAIFIYALMAFLAFRVFLSRKQRNLTTATKMHLPDTSAETVKKKAVTLAAGMSIVDNDKRVFLKIIAATGISFFLISVFGRRVESLLFGRQNSTQTPTSVGNTLVDQVSAATSPTDGYNISEIDDGLISYYGFINREGRWFIMKGDTNTGSFRYARGRSNFPKNWERRHSLNYDYFYQIFP